MPPKTVTWVAEPHTLAKIRIVEEYLKAWFPIISRYNGRVIYIDGFCGPGQYQMGEKGSPIVALETALFHQYDHLKSKELIFVFNDADKNRVDHLRSLIQMYETPKTFRIQCMNNSFKETLQNILDSLNGEEIAPTFLFIDPFGVKDISFDLIATFMQNPKCEILINFMAESINRFACTPEFEQYLNDLYGTLDWKECLGQNDKYESLILLYEARLKEIAKFVWAFEMKDKKNKRKFLLFFATNSIKGLEKMKDAMWKIDPSGDFSFSDRNYDQLTIFNEVFDPTILANIYLRALSGIHRIDEIEVFTLIETPFRRAHVRKALKLLEDDAKILAIRTGKHGYPEGTVIKFS